MFKKEVIQDVTSNSISIRFFHSNFLLEINPFQLTTTFPFDYNLPRTINVLGYGYTMSDACDRSRITQKKYQYKHINKV